MRSERGVWQSGSFLSSTGQASGELSTTGAEGLSVPVVPTAGVFVSVDGPVLLLPACEQAASNRIIAKKEIMDRTGCIYISRSSLFSNDLRIRQFYCKVTQAFATTSRVILMFAPILAV